MTLTVEKKVRDTNTSTTDLFVISGMTHCFIIFSAVNTTLTVALSGNRKENPHVQQRTAVGRESGVGSWYYVYLTTIKSTGFAVCVSYIVST